MSRHPRLVVLHESPHFVVVAKPPGLLVHRNEYQPEAPAALQAVRNMLGTSVYPVHRLDRGASGCLVMATSSEWAALLGAALHAGSKGYVALVRGAYRATEPVTVDRPMKDDNGVVKDAITVIRALGASAEPRCSLMYAEPQTGRYHQVRRHLRDLCHPVIGDGDHGDNAVNREWKTRGVRRLALHAHSLRLALPDGELVVTCPLFSDHHATFSTLPFWSEAVANLPGLDAPPIPAPRRFEPDATMHE